MRVTGEAEKLPTSTPYPHLQLRGARGARGAEVLNVDEPRFDRQVLESKPRVRVRVWVRVRMRVSSERGG